MEITQKQENNKINTLLIIDMQNDFSPEGPLPVKNFYKVIPALNSIMEYFDLVIATQDWHPESHISFFSSHKNKKPFESSIIGGESQVLWPIHCVANTQGAELSNKIHKDKIDIFFKKGTDQNKDAYSAFHLNDKKTLTGLEKILDPKTNRLYIMGVATDICVYYSVKSASELGFETYLIEDLCAGLDEEKETIEIMSHMPNVSIITSHKLKLEKN